VSSLLNTSLLNTTVVVHFPGRSPRKKKAGERNCTVHRHPGMSDMGTPAHMDEGRRDGGLTMMERGQSTTIQGAQDVDLKSAHLTKLINQSQKGGMYMGPTVQARWLQFRSETGFTLGDIPENVEAVQGRREVDGKSHGPQRRLRGADSGGQGEVDGLYM
jgi:hypothetical protein